LTLQVRVSLHEGMFHQVKRMLLSVGGTVVALHRQSFGPVSVAGLPPGGMRRLTDAELCALRDMLPADRSTALAPQMDKARKRRRGNVEDVVVARGAI